MQKIHFIKKTNLLTMCFLASNAYLPAKTYHPFCEEGKKWKVALVHFINSAKDYQMVDCTTYEMKGDTLIDGRTCKKFYEEVYIGAFYEEGKQVYFIPATQTVPVMKYEFNAEKTDSLLSFYDDLSSSTLWLYSGKDYYTASNGEELLTRLVYIYHDFGNEKLSCEDGIWMEGIGSLSSPLEVAKNHSLPSGQTDAMLVECCVGSEVLYSTPYRNTDGIGHLISEKSSMNSTDYSLDGRRADSHAHGIVIKSGRKVIK